MYREIKLLLDSISGDVEKFYSQCPAGKRGRPMTLANAQKQEKFAPGSVCAKTAKKRGQRGERSIFYRITSWPKKPLNKKDKNADLEKKEVLPEKKDVPEVAPKENISSKKEKLEIPQSSPQIKSKMPRVTDKNFVGEKKWKLFKNKEMGTGVRPYLILGPDRQWHPYDPSNPQNNNGNGEKKAEPAKPLQEQKPQTVQTKPNQTLQHPQQMLINYEKQVIPQILSMIPQNGDTILIEDLHKKLNLSGIPIRMGHLKDILWADHTNLGQTRLERRSGQDDLEGLDDYNNLIFRPNAKKFGRVRLNAPTTHSTPKLNPQQVSQIAQNLKDYENKIMEGIDSHLPKGKPILIGDLQNTLISKGAPVRAMHLNDILSDLEKKGKIKFKQWYRATDDLPTSFDNVIFKKNIYGNPDVFAEIEKV